MISIVIPCKNDLEPLERTIKSIQDTATEQFEIVVCDDGSDEPFSIDGAKVIRHKNCIGVGAAIDTAVKHSQYDIIAISGADIVHKDDAWMTKMCASTIIEPKTIFCSVTVGYKPELDVFTERKRYGARMLIKAGLKDIPLSRRPFFPPDWRMIFRSKWNSQPKEELSTLLGAFYVMRKDWYLHLRGFEMHRRWGTLDSYLALKCWLAGGACKLEEDVTTGHHFHLTDIWQPMDWFFYNKALVARTVFPEKEEELLDWISDKRGIEMGVNMLNSYMDEMNELSEYLQSIYIHDYDWYVNKFNIL